MKHDQQLNTREDPLLLNLNSPNASPHKSELRELKRSTSKDIVCLSYHVKKNRKQLLNHDPKLKVERFLLKFDGSLTRFLKVSFAVATTVVDD